MSNLEHQANSEPKSSLERTIEDLAKTVQVLLERIDGIGTRLESAEASQKVTNNYEGEMSHTGGNNELRDNKKWGLATYQKKKKKKVSPNSALLARPRG